MTIEIKGKLEVSPMGISAEEVERKIREFLGHDYCQVYSVELEVKEKEQ